MQMNVTSNEDSAVVYNCVFVCFAETITRPTTTPFITESQTTASVPPTTTGTTASVPTVTVTETTKVGKFQNPLISDEVFSHGVQGGHHHVATGFEFLVFTHVM